MVGMVKWLGFDYPWDPIPPMRLAFQDLFFHVCTVIIRDSGIFCYISVRAHNKTTQFGQFCSSVPSLFLPLIQAFEKHLVNIWALPATQPFPSMPLLVVRKVTQRLSPFNIMSMLPHPQLVSVRLSSCHTHGHTCMLSAS